MKRILPSGSAEHSKPSLARRAISSVFGISGAIRPIKSGGDALKASAGASFGKYQIHAGEKPWPDFQSYVVAYEAAYRPRAGWLERRRRQCRIQAVIYYLSAAACVALPILSQTHALDGLRWLRGEGGSAIVMMLSSFAFFSLLLANGLIAAWRARQAGLKRLIPFMDFLNDPSGWLG